MYQIDSLNNSLQRKHIACSHKKLWKFKTEPRTSASIFDIYANKDLVISSQIYWHSLYWLDYYSWIIEEILKCFKMLKHLVAASHPYIACRWSDCSWESRKDPTLRCSIPSNVPCTCWWNGNQDFKMKL